MHAYDNFTSYDEKLSIYDQGLNSRYCIIIIYNICKAHYSQINVL